MQDFRPLPILRFDPLARLMNYQKFHDIRFHLDCYLQLRLTVVLPLPVAPMTLTIFHQRDLEIKWWLTHAMATSLGSRTSVYFLNLNQISAVESSIEKLASLVVEVDLAHDLQYIKSDILLAIYLILTKFRLLHFLVLGGCKSVWTNWDEPRSRFRCIAWW